MIDLRGIGAAPSGPSVAAQLDEQRRQMVAATQERVDAAVALVTAEKDAKIAALVAQIETLEDQRDALEAQVNAQWAQMEQANGRAATAEAALAAVQAKKK